MPLPLLLSTTLVKDAASESTLPAPGGDSMPFMGSGCPPGHFVAAQPPFAGTVCPSWVVAALRGISNPGNTPVRAGGLRGRSLQPKLQSTGTPAHNVLRLPLIAATIAAPSSFVVAVPPRSGVSVCPAAVTVVIAASIARAASLSPR
jgi:hypothetical protein